MLRLTCNYEVLMVSDCILRQGVEYRTHWDILGKLSLNSATFKNDFIHRIDDHNNKLLVAYISKYDGHQKYYICPC